MTHHPEISGPELGSFIGRVATASTIDTLREILTEAEARFPQDDATPRIRAISKLRIARPLRRN